MRWAIAIMYIIKRIIPQYYVKQTEHIYFRNSFQQQLSYLQFNALFYEVDWLQIYYGLIL